MLLAAFWLHFFIFSTWSFLYFFLKAFFKAKENERQFAAATLRQKEAELLMLRAHLEPHFIFNALNAIMVLSHGNPAVAPVVRGLADYLRFCLANRSKAFVPIGEELDAIEQYLRVEKARFGDDLVVKMEVDAPSSRYIPVPGVFIMPLVENALKHRAPGDHPLYLWIQVVHRRTPGDVELLENLKIRPLHEATHADRLDLSGGGALRSGGEKAFGGAAEEVSNDRGELLIRVTSNSVWQDPASRAAEGPATGVGLSHLRRRLELIYAGEGRAGFTIGPQNGYVVAEIRISDPLRQFRNPSGSTSLEGK
jgi:LytS/YehU family sensor histidine kinase